MNISKMVQIVTLTSTHEQTVCLPINTNVTLLYNLLMPYKESINDANIELSPLLNCLQMLYKESINNADIAYLRITISTVWTLYVDFY